MDHEMIDQALGLLLATTISARTPELIQGIAHFICDAAKAPIGSSTKSQTAHVELHAAAAMLAEQLGSNDHRTYLAFSSDRGPRLSAHITLTDTITLVGWGATAEETMDNLRRDADAQAQNEQVA